MIISKEILADSRYPSFIRTHYLLISTPKFGKIFPKIGLPNYEENITNVKIVSSFIPGNIANYALEHALLKNSSNIFTDVQNFVKSFITCTGTELLDIVDSFRFKKRNSKLKICFSSDEKQGAWDIATMSMRGIQSCQNWLSSKAPLLVGSITDPCCSIIYMTDDTETSHGTKMVYRSVVRYVVHYQLGPCLLLERIYPYIKNHAEYAAVVALFGRSLFQRTGLPVFHSDYVSGSSQRFYIPMTRAINANPSTRSYRDSHIKYSTLRFADIVKYPQLKIIQESFC